MRLIAVRPDLVGKAWPLVETWIAKALIRGRGDVGADFVRGHLERGGMLLWLVWDDETNRAIGCCVTELADSVRGKCCNLVVISGAQFRRWKHLVDVVKAYAKEKGCTRLESGGRIGMVRYLKTEGWRPVRTVIELEL